MSEKLGISLRQYVRIDNEKAFPRRDILRKLTGEKNIALLDDEIFVLNQNKKITKEEYEEALEKILTINGI